MQCFPVYSVLLATNRTEIDFLNLSNLEGRELDIMKTIPWHKVKIKVYFIRQAEDGSLNFFYF